MKEIKGWAIIRKNGSFVWEIARTRKELNKIIREDFWGRKGLLKIVPCTIIISQPKKVK